MTDYPDDAALAAGLATVLDDADCRTGSVAFHRRQVNEYARTFPSELVDYDRAGGDIGRLFCKYMTVLPDDHRDHGSRGGVPYEAMVYERALVGLELTLPTFRGLARDPATGSAWLVLDHVADAVDLDLSEDESALVRAADWLGRFHATLAHRFAGARPSGLTVYDAAYYQGWARRAEEFAGSWFGEFPWLVGFAERFEGAIALLVAAEPTLVHGEFYPHNILVRADGIYPVDWESAAIGAGEIDLVTLSDGWPADDIAACDAAYTRARWPGSAPADLTQTTAAARLFNQVRWLGSNPSWTAHADARWRVVDLGTAAAALGWPVST
ncbi:MAG: phosphotransferase [Gemmataceae bacterium]